MSYAPPLGNDVQLKFTASGYTPNAGNAVLLDFQSDTLDYSFTASGGAVGGGSATVAVAYAFNIVVSGGSLGGGTAVVSLQQPNVYAVTAAGGAIGGGSAAVSFSGTVDVTGAGGAVAGGTATIGAAYTFNVVASGGSVGGGAAVVALFQPLNFSGVGTGGSLGGGAATVAGLVAQVGSGGAKSGGSAITQLVKIMDSTHIGSGGAKSGGTAPSEYVVPALNASLFRPNATLTNAGFNDYIFAQIPKTIWCSVVGQIGADADARLPVMTADVIGLVGTSTSIAAELPTMTASCVGKMMDDGIYATLPLMGASVDAKAGSVGAIDARVPPMLAALTGYTTISGVINARHPAMRAEIFALNGAIGAVAASLLRIRPDIIGYPGVTGSVAAQLPTHTAKLAGYTTSYAEIDAELPSLLANVQAVQDVQHTATLVMNTITSALSVYAGYSFNSFAKIGNNYYAAGPNGLFLIDSGSQDVGASAADIPAAFETGDLDFDSEYQKRLSDFYIGMRADGDIALRVTTDETLEVDYVLEPFNIDTLNQRRVNTARGAQGKYWRFRIENTNGCDFEIDTMNIAAASASRRLKGTV